MQQLKPSTPLVYYPDLLEVDGVSLVDLPIEERRERLEALLDLRNRTVRLSESSTSGEALLAGRRRAGDSRGSSPSAVGSRYAVGKRTREWLKVKTHGDQGSSYRGLHEGPGPPREKFRLPGSRLPRVEARLAYAGNVGTGFMRPRSRS